MAQSQSERKRYRGFISYSQKDKTVARRIHRALENFRIPSLSSSGVTVKKGERLGRFFRDDEELGAASSLGAALEGAIDDAEWLIVICSPNSAKSQWVDAEVRRFKQRDDQKVFAVIVSGEPNSNVPEAECLCPALKYKVSRSGELLDDEDQPLAPDLRKDGLHKIIVRLASGILGVPFDDLWQRARRARGMRRIQRTGVVGAVLIATLAAITPVLSERHQERSRALIRASNEAMSRGYHAAALRLAVLGTKGSLFFDAPPEANSNLLRIAEGNRLVRKYNRRDGYSAISRIKLSPNGRFVIGISKNRRTGNPNSKDDEVLVWNYSDGTLSRVYSFNRKDESDQSRPKLLSFGFSDAGQKAVLYFENGCLTTFRFDDNKKAKTHCLLNDSKSAVFASSDLIVVTKEDQIKAVDLKSMAVQNIALMTNIRELWVNRKGSFLLIKQTDGLFLIDPSRKIKKLTDNASPSAQIAQFTDDDDMLAIGFADGSLRLWNLSSSQEVKGFRGVEGGYSKAAIVTLAFSADGGKLLAGTSDGRISYWDTVKRVKIATMEGHIRPQGGRLSNDSPPSFDITSLSFSKDGHRFMSASAYGGIRIWRSSTVEMITEFNAHVDVPKTAYVNEGGVSSATFDSTGYFILSAGLDGSLYLWDAMFEDWRQSRAWLFSLPKHPTLVNDLSFSSDSKFLASLDANGELRIYRNGDLSNFDSYSSPSGSPLSTMAWRPNAHHLALGTGDGSVAIWNVRTFKKISEFVLPKDIELPQIKYETKKVRGQFGDLTTSLGMLADGPTKSVKFKKKGARDISFSSDAKRLAVSYNNGVVAVYDTETKRAINIFLNKELATPWMFSVAISPDGKTVISGYFNTLQAWDVETGLSLYRIKSEKGGEFGTPLSIDFNSDGSRFATAHFDTSVRLWNTQSGKILREYRGHGGRAYNVVFSPDDTRLLSSALDYHARIWDVISGKQIMALNIERFGGGVSFNSSGNKVLTGNHEGDIRVWDVKTSTPKRSNHDLIQYVCNQFSNDYKFLIANVNAVKQPLNEFDIVNFSDVKFLPAAASFQDESVCSSEDQVFVYTNRILEWVHQTFPW